ncbi:MAG: hypothetical protein IJV83_02475 [Clostridia bacterium]|nr:hypothetical protein [Clostridia bacterium]
MEKWMLDKYKVFIYNSIRHACYHKLEKIGINGRRLSHNRTMENKLQQQNFTKGAEMAGKDLQNVTLSAKEAAEYSEYKRQRKRADVKNALTKSVGVMRDCSAVKRVCSQAAKYKQSAVQTTSSGLEYGQPWLRASGVRTDCFIGGNGEVLSKAKAYEAKCALRLRAKELTLILSTDALLNCRYGGIRKEIKKIRRIAKKAVLKVRLGQQFSVERVARVSKICGDLRVDYLSVPYFSGCERLRSGLSGGCCLEVFGVEKTDDYRRLILAGVERIVTEKAEEIYTEWMREAEQVSFGSAIEKNREEKVCLPPQTEEEEVMKESEKVKEIPSKNPQTDYECRLEGNELKFS